MMKDETRVNETDLPNKSPLVSVVIPSFNAGIFLEACIESVVEQTYKNIEIVLVDDGSTDGSIEHVMSKFKDIKLVKQKNSGISASRNAGIKSSSGEWVAFLDADDIWLPGKISAQISGLTANPQTLASFGVIREWQSSGFKPSKEEISHLIETPKKATRETQPYRWMYRELLEGLPISTITVILHRSVLDETGLFNEELEIAEDLDLWIRVSRVTQFYFVDDLLSIYRRHGNSATRKLYNFNWEAIVIDSSLKKWGLRDREGKDAALNKVNKRLSKCWADYSYECFRRKKYKHGFYSANISLRYNYKNLFTWRIVLIGLIKSALRA